MFPSYLGLAQGFVEGNYPFDVVFAGDGRYVKDRLDAKQLEPYATIIVPSPVNPTENQNGSYKHLQRPVALSSVRNQNSLDSPRNQLDGQTIRVPGGNPSFATAPAQCASSRVTFTLTDTHDVGSTFFRQYTPELRSQVAHGWPTILGLAPLLERPFATVFCQHFPVWQRDQGRLVVHLVNYDVDYARDAIRPKKDVHLTLPAPAFLAGQVRGSPVSL